MEDPDKQTDLKKSHLDMPSQPSKVEIVTKLFSEFSEKEASKEFDIMKEDLIAFVAYKEGDQTEEELRSDEWAFKNLLYNSLEKTLIETMYINKKDYRKERIMKLFNWYQNQLKTFKDLRFINKKSYNDIDAVQDEDYFKEKLDLIQHEADHRIQDDILKEQMSHRSAIFDKGLLDEFKRNHVYDNIFYKRMYKKLEKNKSAKFSKKNLKPELEKPDRPVGTHNIYYTFKDGTRPLSIAKFDLNEKKILDFPAGGERARTFHTRLGAGKYQEVEIDKEIKGSYSYYRPSMDFNLLNAEKNIAEKKNKLLKEKRSYEELYKNLKDFGRMRAQYKASKEKKFELKKLISVYTNQKKIETPMLAKYRKNNIPQINEEENKKSDYVLVNRMSTISVKHLTPYQINKENKLDKKFYPKKTSDFSEYDYYEREEEEKRRKEQEKEDMNIKRKFQKKYTHANFDLGKKFKRIEGDKIIMNEAKNLDKSTKEIINNSSEKISKININLKFRKIDTQQKLMRDRLIQGEEEKKKTPYDITYKLISNDPAYQEKLVYKKLCDLNTINHDDRKQNESEEEEESIYNNFCLSAYNIKNNNYLEKVNKKVDSDVKIMRHISSYTKFNDRKKLLSKNDSFNNYRYNYLDLRKTIGEFKKYEYQEVMNRFSKKKENKETETRNTIRIKDPLPQKIVNLRYKKQQVLSNALMNPVIDNTFPKYFLPRTGSLLISKNEPPAAKKKKKRRR